jgi:hypothetical protein
MQRLLLIQSMTRATIRRVLAAVWDKPFCGILAVGLAPAGLGHSSSKESTSSFGQCPKVNSASSGQLSNTRSESGELHTVDDAFESLVFEVDGVKLWNTIVQQYHDVYDHQVAIGSDTFSVGSHNSQSRSIYLVGARSSELSVRIIMQEDNPSAPLQFFIGREIDMY